MTTKRHSKEVLTALKKGHSTITEISQVLKLHPCTVSSCLEFLKIQHPIAEQSHGVRKYYKHVNLKFTSTLPKGDPGSPNGHLTLWGQS